MFGHSALSEVPFASQGDRITLITTAFAASATMASGDLASQYRISAGFTGSATLMSAAGRIARVATAFLGSVAFGANARLIGAAVSFSFGSAAMTADGRRIRGVRSVFTGSVVMGAYAQSAFEDLLENPNRRLVYTIEISPWLLVPYDEAA